MMAGLSALKGRLFKSNLAQQTVLYGLVNGVATAIPVAVGPILTHYLVPKDYGIASLFTAAFNFVAPLSGMGVHSAVRRRYFQKEQYDFPSYVLSSSLFSIAQAALLSVIAYFTFELWATEKVGRVWALTLFPYLVGRYLDSSASNLLQLEQRPLAFGVLSWVQNLLNVALTLLLVIAFGYGWEGRVLGQVFSSFGIGVAGAFIIRKLVGAGARWDWKLAKDAIAFGSPAVPYALLDRALRFGDRAIIASMSGLEQVGLYAIGSQVSNLNTQFSTALNLAWQPWLFRQLKEGSPRSQRRVVVAFYVATATTLGSGVALWLATRWLFPFIVGDKYLPTVSFMPYLCMGFAFRGIATYLSGIVLYSGQTRSLTTIAVVVGVTNIAAAFVLVKTGGAAGASQAMFLAYLLNMLIMWYKARRLVPLPGL
jgi:O-antigen/teichoic acid export membrane protein